MTAYKLLKQAPSIVKLPPLTAFSGDPLKAYDLFTYLTQYVGFHTYDDFAARMVEQAAGVELTRDTHGNFFVEVGEGSSTLFCAHLDTVHRGFSTTKRTYHTDVNGDLIMETDGSTILGADDRSGCTVLCYLIRKEIPGLYYFFTAEEVGRIGSEALASSSFDFSPFSRAIQVDRRGTSSVITHQSSQRTCSNAFANALIEALGMNHKRDTGGSFTDTYSFRKKIPECTNISAGYTGAHTSAEDQNITYLQELCERMAIVDWEMLPTERDPSKYEGLYATTYNYGYPRSSSGGTGFWKLSRAERIMAVLTGNNLSDFISTSEVSEAITWSLRTYPDVLDDGGLSAALIALSKYSKSPRVLIETILDLEASDVLFDGAGETLYYLGKDGPA